MVRKSKIICGFVLALALLLAVPVSASAYQVYTEGNISSTYTGYFRDIIASTSPFDDYVYWRSGQYEYSMVVGQLDFTGGRFYSSETCTLYKFTTTSGFNSSFTYSTADINDFNLQVGSALVYSNLGNFPNLTDRGDFYALASLLLLLVALCLYLIRSIFGFSLRHRR